MSTTYTADEIDEKLAKTMSDITDKLDKVIVMASGEHDINPVETSLYMQVVAKDEKG
jgi:hypothetical protein